MSAATGINYRLTVIGDEPMAPKAAMAAQGSGYLSYALLAMALCLVVFIAALYIRRCMSYRQRIAVLTAEGVSAYRGWNIIRLKEEKTRMEFISSGDILI